MNSTFLLPKPDNIAIIIIPVIIAILIILLLIKLKFIKLDCLSIEQSENCQLDYPCKKEFFNTYSNTFRTLPITSSTLLNTYSNTSSTLPITSRTLPITSRTLPITSRTLPITSSTLLNTYSTLPNSSLSLLNTYSNTYSNTSSTLSLPYTSLQISSVINSYLKQYPPNKNPSKITYNNTGSDYNCSSTDILVEYDYNANAQYKIRTSYTYRNNYENWYLNKTNSNFRDLTDSSYNNFKIDNLVDINNSTSWRSFYNIYFQPPNYNGSAFLDPKTQIKGEYIYYKLPNRITLFNYTISSNNNRPRTWIFYGSNDEINWTEIEDASQKDALEDTNYINNKYTKYLYPRNFQYFGIVITSITGAPNYSGDFCAYVSNIRFYGV